MSEASKTFNGYSLLRDWWNFAFENPDTVRPVHSAMYSYLIDKWNRHGQKEKLGLPTGHSMEAIGIHSYNTYKAALQFLIDSGFVKMIFKSNNHHHSNVIGLLKNNKVNNKALDKANTIAGDKLTDIIIKQVNKGTRERAFTPPTSLEVKEYFLEIGLNGNADDEASTFIDNHISKGWMIGRSKMKDWKAACRNWKRKMKEFNSEKINAHERKTRGKEI